MQEGQAGGAFVDRHDHADATCGEEIAGEGVRHRRQGGLTG